MCIITWAENSSGPAETIVGSILLHNHFFKFKLLIHFVILPSKLAFIYCRCWKGSSVKGDFRRISANVDNIE